MPSPTPPAAPSRVRPLLRAAAATTGAVAAAGALTLAWGTYEVDRPRLRRVEVPVLPPGRRPLRVLHLSDLHLLPAHERTRRWVAQLADLEPDLVVDTGDNLGGAGAVPTVLEALDGLLDRPGVFVLGSNDRYGPRRANPFRYLRGPSRLTPDREELPTADLVDGFRRRGWVDLDNARADLEVDGLHLSLVGSDDPHIDLDRYDDVRRPAPPTDADVALGVVHAPYRRVLDPMAADGLDLVLAGHTHGGQVCVPGFGALVTNCDVPRRAVKGLTRWRSGVGPVDAPTPLAPGRDDDTWLHVSAGVGASVHARVRVACRPEATLLRLVPRPA